MGAIEQKRMVWRQASEDLGFDFIAPFELADSGRTYVFFGLLPQFGGEKGMLVVVGFDYEEHIRAAQRNGYGWSCLGDGSEPYDREVFMDVLNDWGWSDPSKKLPYWYTGKPWTL
jgi:hypothetical protein